MSSGRRVLRMNELLRTQLSRILLEEISDPRLTDVVVTDVRLSGDLRVGKVFYAPTRPDISKEQEKGCERGFKHASPYFRRRLAENLELRYVPELLFFRDHHGEELTRLLKLLSVEEAKKKKENISL